MKVLALAALRTQAAGEEEAEVGARDLVGARVAAVEGDVAAAFGLVFGEVRVFGCAAGPFVVPSTIYISLLF